MRASSTTTRSGSKSWSKTRTGPSFVAVAARSSPVSKSTTGTADSQTQIGWEVDDLRAELDELMSRGVTIEDYDLPGLKTEDGIADVGFALIAWIVDPGKNALAIMQPKG